MKFTPKKLLIDFTGRSSLLHLRPVHSLIILVSKKYICSNSKVFHFIVALLVFLVHEGA